MCFGIMLKNNDTSKERTTFHSFIPLACAECDESLLFSGASSTPLCYVLFPATLLHQVFFHPLSPHLAIYFLVYLSILLFPNSYMILFWESYFLPFSLHTQNQCNLFNLIVSVIVSFHTFHKFLYWLTSSNFLFQCHILDLKFFYTLSFQKC